VGRRRERRDCVGMDVPLRRSLALCLQSQLRHPGDATHGVRFAELQVVSARSLRLCSFAFALLTALASSAQALELTSSDVANGAMLRTAQVHSRCGGENRSPALAWSGAPKGTQSYAVTMFDSDANGGRGFWHWVIFDIPSATQTLGAGLAPAAALPNGSVQADNDFATPGY